MRVGVLGAKGKVGREVCKAVRPRCEACPLTDLCDYYREVVARSVRASTKASKKERKP